MSSSRQNHTRFRISREIKNLLNRPVVVCIAGKETSDLLPEDILEFKNGQTTKPGYYLVRERFHIPLRAITELNMYEFTKQYNIKINPDYLKNGGTIR